MFNDLWYVKTDEFKNIDDLREWMKYQGHLWFFIGEKYYFITGSRNYNTKGEVVPWWYITNGDYRNLAVSEEVGAKILWEFWDIEDMWKAKIFDGKSFAENFDEFIFFS